MMILISFSSDVISLWVKSCKGRLAVCLEDNTLWNTYLRLNHLVWDVFEQEAADIMFIIVLNYIYYSYMVLDNKLGNLDIGC